MDIKKKKSVPLIVSAVLGVAYSVYIIAYFSGAIGGAESDTDALAGALATALVAPHMICVVIAAIFNVIAAITSKPALALVGAILYCVGAVLFLVYALFVVPSIILSFIGFAQLRKRQSSLPR